MRVLNRLSSRQFDPWREMVQMQSDVERLLGGFGLFSGRATVTTPGTRPAVNLYETATGLIATAELPGVDPASLEVVVEGDSLSLKGSFGSEPNSDTDGYRRRERPRGEFSRSVTLPYAVESDSTQAEFADGVLTIQLTKPVAARPRRIDVRVTPSAAAPSGADTGN
jgi:HSP20 family protein